MKLKGKIGVYGRSLGGIPAAYLNQFGIDLVICDRTMSNLESLSAEKFYSRVARYLFRIGTLG